MNRVNMNLHSQSLANQMLKEKGLDSEYLAEVKVCTNLRQVFDAISEKAAEHFAILSPNGQPIDDIFGHIKCQLSEGLSVSVAVFFKQAELESWNPADSV